MAVPTRACGNAVGVEHWNNPKVKVTRRQALESIRDFDAACLVAVDATNHEHGRP